MNASLKILVAEPSLLLRCGIVAVLDRMAGFDARLIEAGDATELAEALSRHRPDVLVVNPAMPGSAHPSLLRDAAGLPSLRCVALLATLSAPQVAAAYDAAIGLYDSADEIRRKLQPAVRPDPDSNRLSVREREIVACVARGWSNRRIAERLFISTHTVATHRRNIAAKLQIHSPAALTVYAIVNRLVALEDIRDSVSGPCGE